MKPLTIDNFIIAAGINASTADKWYGSIVSAMKARGITDVHDVAMFIAQTGHESASFSILSEGFNYSAAGLQKTFCNRLTADQISSLGRHPGETSVPISRQQIIANTVYAGRNGNALPSDGWNYRGRGLIQITGRTNYLNCGKAINLNLIANPDLLLQPGNAALSAAWFYVSSGCLKYSGDIYRITKIINGGQNGIDDRQQRYTRALNALM